MTAPAGAEEIERALAYVSNLDPMFRQRIQGAGEGEIALLQSYAPRPLPEAYTAFLRRMGRKSDWLALRQIDFSIGAVLEHSASRTWRPPEEFTLIGVDRGEAGAHAYLMPLPSRETAVVTMPDLEYERDPVIEKWVRVHTGSLAELLCRQAFQYFRLDRLPVRESLALARRREDAIELAGRIAAELGYARHWYSSSFSGYFEREGAAFRASQPPRYAMAVELGSDSEAGAVRLRALLIGVVGMEQDQT